MARTLGYILGGMSLVDSIIGVVNPRWGFRVWENNLRRYFPKPMDELTMEYSRLSDPAIRYFAFWEMLLAGAILWLASKARD